MQKAVAWIQRCLEEQGAAIPDADFLTHNKGRMGASLRRHSGGRKGTGSAARQGDSSFFCPQTNHLRRDAGERAHGGGGTARQILSSQQTGRQRVGCPPRDQLRRLLRKHQFQPQMVEQGS